MNLSKRFFTLGSVVVGLTVAAALPSACSSSDEGGTTGRRIALTVKVTGSPEAKAPFTNAQGWTITLSKAVIATGAFYYYDGATIFSLNERFVPAQKSPGQRLWEVLGERTAFAHPGHYIPGNAKGEYLVSSSADLRSETVLGQGNGVTGVVRSATFSFGTPAAGALAAELGSHVVVLEGTATKGAETRVFRAEVDAQAVHNTSNLPAVEGCPFVETDMQEDGVVTVTVGVAQWFDQVELDAVPASADGKPALLPVAGIGHNALVRGMKEGLAYSFSYAPN